MTTLPQAFIETMAEALGGELPAFLAAYDQPYQRGLRRNPFKQPQSGLSAWLPEMGEPIPWEPQGNYLSQDSLAGSHPLHEGGAYYLQEPSAMIPAAVLAPRPGDRVLDLCAAPGGKSTQLAVRLAGRGLLVCNEPVPNRAQVLSRNIERMGVPNALVVSALPECLASRWEDFFDGVMVDAPCSGEGMFRRHPETREEWSPQAPQGCAKRQREILWQAARMVRPGGRLCYATCTLNPVENDGVIADFLAAHEAFELTPFTLHSLAAREGMLHIYPHRVRGEGHFVALMTRRGESAQPRASCGGLKPPEKAACQALAAIQTLAGWEGLQARGMLGDTLFHLAEWPDVSGIKVLRAGLHLGQLRGKAFVPDHALALSWGAQKLLPTASVSLEQARAYLRGEPLPWQGRGWHILCLDGVPLGWGKASDGLLKNHYPKGLRTRK